MFELSGEIVQVAVALVHASAAAYHTDPTLHSHWPMLGMDRVATFPVEWDENRGSTHGFVASNDEHLVVAFRGSDDVLDLAINLSVAQKIRAPYSGAVHEGFAVALEEVWMELRTLVEEMVPAGKSIWITGHSLGGALATLTATRLAAFLTPVRCFTFGQPRVGDPEFFQDYQVQHHRFVNEHDMIPKLPPRGLFTRYWHVGKEHRMDAAGNLFSGEGDTSLLEDLFFGRLARTFDLSSSENERFLDQLIQTGLEEHRIRTYIERVETLHAR